MNNKLVDQIKKELKPYLKMYNLPSNILSLKLPFPLDNAINLICAEVHYLLDLPISCENYYEIEDMIINKINASLKLKKDDPNFKIVMDIRNGKSEINSQAVQDEIEIMYDLSQQALLGYAYHTLNEKGDFERSAYCYYYCMLVDWCSGSPEFAARQFIKSGNYEMAKKYYVRMSNSLKEEGDDGWYGKLGQEHLDKEMKAMKEE